MSKKIVIIGGGLTGLSTALHLSGEDYELFEKGDRVGGLCRSSKVDGFTFDYTGHLLHFRKQEIKTFVKDLLKGQLNGHGRESFIFSKGVFTSYPFQANTHGLPPEVVKECILGFVESFIQHAKLKSLPHSNGRGRKIKNEFSFEDWIVRTFGGGIARHFMIPFNEKLWKRPLNQLTSDWVSWLVPKPNLEDVVNGALGLKRRELGYNPAFFYPKKGGIETLPRMMGKNLNHVHLREEVESVITKKKILKLKSGRTIRYDVLVSTMPLPELIKNCVDLTPSMKKISSGLEYISVYNVNLGVSRKELSKKHWVYFPEKEFPFYRVGFPMNFSSSLAPKGMSSLYVEISHPPDVSIPQKVLLGKVRKGLVRSGILLKNDEISVSQIQNIDYAYVIFNPFRQKHLPSLLQKLKKLGIYSIGRYGAWEHTSMEDAIFQGKQTAMEILK
jgi:protoporphyrinogen oxidase